jgi:serine O-acetyltransferase
MVFRLLKADLERQYRLAEKSCHASIWRVLLRILHPRFLPLVLIRLSHAAAGLGIPAIPQMFGYFNIILFGLDVASKCEIGPGLFLPHTSGTVIGAGKIGRNAIIFQNVTLGAREPDMGWDVNLRPEIGNDVTLGAGCKVLGGIRVADSVTVGANAVVLNSIDSYSVAVGIPARVVRSADVDAEEAREKV